MKTIVETDSEFICDIQAPCFQMLSHEETELVRASKTQILFRNILILCNVLQEYGTVSIVFCQANHEPKAISRSC